MLQSEHVMLLSSRSELKPKVVWLEKGLFGMKKIQEVMEALREEVSILEHEKIILGVVVGQ